MNVPNFLTVVRIVLSFLFLALVLSEGILPKGCALLVFLLASVTDYWDGEIARRSGQITHFGKLMDPIADKLLTLSAFFTFAWLGLYPWWMAVIVAARDLWITVYRLRMPSKDGESQSAKTSGKVKTAIQFAFIIGVLGYLAAAEAAFWKPGWTAPSLTVIRVLMGVIVLLTVWSAAQFFMKSRGETAKK